MITNKFKYPLPPGKNKYNFTFLIQIYTQLKGKACYVGQLLAPVAKAIFVFWAQKGLLLLWIFVKDVVFLYFFLFFFLSKKITKLLETYVSKKCIGFHWIRPYADSVYNLQCPCVICCPLLQTLLLGRLEVSGWRSHC